MKRYIKTSEVENSKTIITTIENQDITQDAVESCEGILLDNGVDEEVVQDVLQAIGYNLLGIELYPETEIESCSKPVKASYSWEPEFNGYWTDEDIETWESVDWRARNYKEFPVESDTFEGKLTVYGVPGFSSYPVTFVKYIRSNPIFPPYYGPVEDAGLKDFMRQYHLVGSMYDGNNRNGYDIHDRVETSELYERMSR